CRSLQRIVVAVTLGLYFGNDNEDGKSGQRRGMNELEQDFLQQMQDVTPLQTKVKHSLSKGSIDRATMNARRVAAQTQSEPDLGSPVNAYVKPVGPHDPIGYKRPGIQDGVYRKLRLGRYEIEARLDLHRRTLEQARRELLRFVRECMEHDLRSVLILPGKGDRNQKDPAVLKSFLAHWLPELDDVQAFHTAQPHHGGAGAFYVLLRK